MKSISSLFLAAFLALCVVDASGHAGHAGFEYSTLAGTAGSLVRSADGTGSAAQFDVPRGVALDAAGNAYVADASNNTVRKITAAGVVTTLAGTAGSQGAIDGTGAAARFIDPYAIASDSAGNLYVADTSNNQIRKVTPAGVVTTFAGNRASGSADGTGTVARFWEPRGIAVDSQGNVYVGDYRNHTVRKITPAGVVTTLAGTAGAPGSTDGTGSAARFRGLAGVAVDSAGNVYVADTDNSTIRKVTAAGVVTTLAGTVGSTGTTDGPGTTARFSEPRGVAVDTAGTVYVADYANHAIRKVTASGTVTTLAGSGAVPGITDGSGSAARFYFPSGITVDAAGTLLVADTSNATIRRITAAGVVTTLAGLATRAASLDGTGAAARFDDPYAVAADANSNVYVLDPTAHVVRKVTSAGVVTTLAGTAGSFGSADGTGAAARFTAPLGIAVDSGGTVYVADTGNYTVRKITAAGVVTTVAGLAGVRGSANGTGAAARFNSPIGIAVDTTGNLYVVDSETIRKITPAGVVTTLAGTNGSSGFADGTGAAARFTVPFDVAVDTAGNVYVCDHGNHAVRKITPAGVVTTLAGSGVQGSSDGTGSAASFNFPSGIAVDPDGTVFLADNDNHVLRMITAAGVVTTVGGTVGVRGSSDGYGSSASFFNPKDITVDPLYNLYVADRGNHTIRKGVPANPTPLLGMSTSNVDFGGQSLNTTSAPSPVVFSNTAVAFVTVTSITTTANFAVSHNCTSIQFLANCQANVTFTPTADGAVTGTMTVVSSLGTRTVALTGTGERSLVTHYYRSILGRTPDAAGKAYWDSEAARVQGLGANVNEVWFALAGAFYSSAEYLALGRDNAGFVTDLYNTFFNRAPDSSGLSYWSLQLNSGMPREVVLASFMFSSEFAVFTQGIFGTATVRKEVDTVVDFYRGLLARLPDNAGFAFWLQKFRAAQCQGAAAVTTQAESISSQFAQSAEYAGRNRSNAQYVGDLYNAFLRRGGDLAGVLFWVGQIDTAARNRENVRQQFVASPEFSARVASVIAQGCLP